MTGSRNGATDGSKYHVPCFLGLTIAILSGQG